MRIVVIGNGVAGSAVARSARRRGHDVRVIARARPHASLAALAVLRKSYVAGEADGAEALSFALGAYLEAGCGMIEGAMVSAAGREGSRFDPGWVAVNPTPYLVQPDSMLHVEPGWTAPDADWTVWATGHELGGRQTIGVTWLNFDSDALAFEGLRVHRYAPYRTVDAVRYSDSARIGSSSAATLDGALAQAQRQFELADDLGWVRKRWGWVYLIGTRGHLEHTAMKMGPGVICFGGFHRSGWTLAPLRAERLVEALEQSWSGQRAIELSLLATASPMRAKSSSPESPESSSAGTVV